jgi:hypothetical protein
MGAQTAKKNYSYPKGVALEVSTDSGSSWEDVGVMSDGVSWTLNYDLSEIENGNQADPDAQAKNMSVSISPTSLRSWGTDVMAKLSAGLITREAVAGTLVSGASQIVSSGDWGFNEGILIDGQNANGTAPSINSITGSVNGAGASDDYDVYKGAGGWYIVPLDGTNFDTEAQSMTINYDYTPAEGSYLYAGTSSKVLDYIQARVRHYTDDALTLYDYEALFYRVRPDAGAIVMTKSGALSGNGLDEWTVALTGELESGNTDGRQLFRIYQADSALD